MFSKRFSRALAVTAVASLIMASTAFADQITGEADGDILSSPHGTSSSHTQQPGTTVAYSFSALIRETGNADNDVFPGTLPVSVTRSGDWLATDDAGSPAALSFTGYDEANAKTGTVRVTVPCGTTSNTSKTMGATLTGGTSTNGNTLSSGGNNTITLSFNITASGSDHLSCVQAPSNRAPVADAGGPYAGDEGSAVSIDGSNSSDADNDPLTYKWTYSVVIADAGASCAFADDEAVSTTVTCDDDGEFELTLTVDDGDLSDSDTATLMLNNVAPSFDTGNPAFATASVSCLNNTVTLHFAFSDDGSNDTHTASINWGDGSAVQNLNETDTAAETATHTYNSGGPYTASVNVTDDDGDATGATNTTNTLSVLFNDSGIRQPINSNGMSVFKLGSTIPVKIQFTDCDGNIIDTLAPTVDLRKVDSSSGTEVNEAPPAASADAGNVMRWSADGMQYIFNLSTKRSQFAAGGDLTNGTYELKIFVGSQLQETVRFDIKK